MAIVKLTIFANPLEFCTQITSQMEQFDHFDAFTNNYNNNNNKSNQTQMPPSNANKNYHHHLSSATNYRQKMPNMPDKRLYQNNSQNNDNFTLDSSLKLNLNQNLFMQQQQQHRNSSHQNDLHRHRVDIRENNNNTNYKNNNNNNSSDWNSEFADSFHSEFNHLFINREECQINELNANQEQHQKWPWSKLNFKSDANLNPNPNPNPQDLLETNTIHNLQTKIVNEISSKQQFLKSLNKLNRFQRSLRWKSQQIMDYFLFSATGSATISAHDAIDRLQVSSSCEIFSFFFGPKETEK